MLFLPILFSTRGDKRIRRCNGTVFNVLFLSAFIFSICQGLYEAVINPLIAQLYPDIKTHYLNILHAGWPAGMIVGGLCRWIHGENAWFIQLPAVSCSLSVVVVLYGIMVLPEKFPETVGESSGNFATVFSCFISIPFLVLIVLHALVGYMELGVDSWMTKLMENLLPNSILILVYTSLLMFVLRFLQDQLCTRLTLSGLLLQQHHRMSWAALAWFTYPERLYDLHRCNLLFI